MTVVVVGVTEDFEAFVEVLEVLLPQFFKGAEQYLRFRYTDGLID